MRIDFLFAPDLPWIMRFGIAFAVTIIIIITLYFTYRRLFRRLPRKFAWIISTSKLLAGIILLMLIFRPVVYFNNAETFDKTVLLMFDTSESMSIKDSVGNTPRLQAALQKLDETGVLRRIKDNFNVQSYAFDDADNVRKLDKPNDLEGIVPAGVFTEIIGSAHKVLEKADAKKVGAVVLFTDGIENSTKISNKTNLDTRVFTVGIGSSPDGNPFFQDISIDAEAPGQVIAGNKTEIVVTVKISGDSLKNKYRSLPVTLISDDKTIEGIAEFTGDSSTATISLFAKPANVGKKTYVVSVPVDEAESIVANNSKELEFRVGNPKIRILYVEGFPRYEFKGIVSVLGSDPNVELTALINYGGGSYTAQGETLPDVDLSKGLPQKLVEYENIDIVILGDLKPTDLSDNQQELLKKWVIDGIKIKDEEKHGNLLFLGGTDSLSGSWQDSPLAELMPVELPQESSFLTSGQFFVEITKEGLQNPVCKGMPLYLGESDKLRSFKKLNGFSRIKPAAESLMNASDENGNVYNVVVAQTAGGRIAVNGLADTWKSWSFSPAGQGGRTLFTVFWGQLIRWLAGAKEEEIDDTVTIVLPTEKTDPGKSVEFRVIVKDRQHKLIDGATIEASIQSPRNENTILKFEPSGLPGQYITKFLPQFVGKYQIQCSVWLEGIKIGGDNAVFVVGQELSEFYRIGIDRNYLKELAARNSGKYFNLMTLENLPDALRNAFKEEERLRKQEYSPSAVLFLLFVLLLSVEWFVRRKLHII